MPSDGMKYEQALFENDMRRKALSDMIKKKKGKGPKARIPENAPKRVTMYPVSPRQPGGPGGPTTLPRQPMSPERRPTPLPRFTGDENLANDNRKIEVSAKEYARMKNRQKKLRDATRRGNRRPGTMI